MPTIDEKRVYDAKTGAKTALVASPLGVVAARVSDDIVGEFGVEHRCTARDLAAAGDVLAVATDEDVLVGAFEPTGHGPAVAVGIDDDAVLAAAPDGTVSRLPSDVDGRTGGNANGRTDDEANGRAGDDAGEATAGGASDWVELGRVEEPRRIAGPLVAAADGVHRVRGDVVEFVGLDDARDAAAGGGPLAATAEGLYTLGNGWMRDLSGEFRAVATDPAGERAVAATGEAVYERADDGVEWTEHAEADAVDVAVDGDLLVAVTADGELRVAHGGDWRGRHLGVPDASAVVLPGAE